MIVHGAWHTGKELEPVAKFINSAGHNAYTPTIKGNRPGDSKTVGLDEAIGSIVDYLDENDFKLRAEAGGKIAYRADGGVAPAFSETDVA